MDLAEIVRKKIHDSSIKNDQKNIIILADPDQPENFRYDDEQDILYVKVKECYTRLSYKTQLMIQGCAKLFDFDFLVKWDASTADISRCYEKEDFVDCDLKQLEGDEFKDKHYYSHLKTKCNGILSKRWFMSYKKQFLEILKNENRDLESENLIPEMIDYYRGKFYIISKEFCSYINDSSECKTIFRESFQHNFGNEDMSVGMCFQKFKEHYDKR